MRLTDISFSYGDKRILARFSLELPDTGVTALAGPSGCGKTTLLRLIAGLETPTGGVLEGPSPSDISFLFQEDRLLPGLKVAEQLQAVLPRGGDVSRWLTLMGLEKELHAPIGSLSGGMRRRVALARCMAYGADKKLILLDEPFTGIDPARARSIMEELRKSGVPVIFSAHDAESLSLADRMVRFEGPPLVVVE